MNVSLSRVSEKQDFMNMALAYFRELNPQFEPAPDWKRSYFEGIQGTRECSLCWILLDGMRAGFVLYGTEQHRFLPRRTGVIYELYVRPEHRRKRIAKTSAELVIGELRKSAVSKIQVELIDGNQAAQRFWKDFGFSKVAERFVLPG